MPRIDPDLLHVRAGGEALRAVLDAARASGHQPLWPDLDRLEFPAKLLDEVFDHYPFMVPNRASMMSACILSGNGPYMRALQDTDFYDALAGALAEWLDPAFNRALSRHPVLMTFMSPRPEDLVDEAFLVRQSRPLGLHAYTILVPAVLASSCTHWRWRRRPLKHLFSTHEEADTTLGLWTPGSGDEWASFDYAHQVARAL